MTPNEAQDMIQRGLSEYNEDNPGKSDVTQFRLISWADMARQSARFTPEDFLRYVELTDPLTVSGTRFVAQWTASNVSGQWAQFTVLSDGDLWTDDVYARWEDIDTSTIQQVQPALVLPEETS